MPTARRRWPIPAWPPSIYFLRKRLSYYSPHPSPVSGLVDSLILLQLRHRSALNAVGGCGLRATHLREEIFGWLERLRSAGGEPCLFIPQKADITWRDEMSAACHKRISSPNPIIGGCGDEQSTILADEDVPCGKGRDTSQMMDQVSASLTCLSKKRVSLSTPRGNA